MFKDQLKTSKVHKNVQKKNFIIKPKHPDNNWSNATKCIQLPTSSLSFDLLEISIHRATTAGTVTSI